MTEQVATHTPLLSCERPLQLQWDWQAHAEPKQLYFTFNCPLLLLQEELGHRVSCGNIEQQPNERTRKNAPKTLNKYQRI